MSRVVQEMSRVSIRDHSANPNTDQLYDPLRETLLNPSSIQRHAPLTPLVTRSSFVSKDYRILSPQELQLIESNTYIPQNVQLLPTHNLEPIRNEKFVAVDACERILGPPITPEQLERIRSQGVKRSEVLYEVRQPSYEMRPSVEERQSSGQRVTVIENSREVVNARQEASSRVYAAAPNASVQQLNYYQPAQPQQQQVYVDNSIYEERYKPQNFEGYGRSNWNYKYNLFSMIDEPANRCRELGVEGCGGCPGNEIVAARNRPQSLAWE